jgi:hypothetical protein
MDLLKKPCLRHPPAREPAGVERRNVPPNPNLPLGFRGWIACHNREGAAFAVRFPLSRLNSYGWLFEFGHKALKLRVWSEVLQVIVCHQAIGIFVSVVDSFV